MRDRRVLSSLVTIGLIASLVLPTAVSLAASPEPKSSDPKASGTEGVTVLAATASRTISVSGGPLTITINNELNGDVDHVADPLHGEFYGETACATLVAVDGTLLGPSFIPAGGSASPRTTFTPVSQTQTGDGSAATPWTITTVVTLGSTGLTLTEHDVTRLFNFTPAPADDGAFDTRVESYGLSDGPRTGGNYVAYDVEIRVATSTQSTTRTTGTTRYTILVCNEFTCTGRPLP